MCQQDGCRATGATGDSIHDTPRQAEATIGCPVGRDSCPGKKKTLIVSCSISYRSIKSTLFFFVFSHTNKIRFHFFFIGGGEDPIHN